MTLSEIERDRSEYSTIDGLSVSPGGGTGVTVEVGCVTEVLVALGTARVDDGIITREMENHLIVTTC